MPRLDQVRAVARELASRLVVGCSRTDGRWVFDVILSNPSSARLYKLTPRQYTAAVGCAH